MIKPPGFGLGLGLGLLVIIPMKGYVTVWLCLIHFSVFKSCHFS